MVRDSLALRLIPAVGACVALTCFLSTVSSAGAAGSPGPDPGPGPTPDPYTAPALPRAVAPALRQVRTPAPSRTRAPATTPVRTHVRSSRRPPTAAAVDPPLPRPRSMRTGPVRSFAGTVAAAVATTHRLSRTLALAVALLVLLSGAFVLTAAREIAR